MTLDESTEETAGAAAVESESTGPKKFAPIQWTGPEAAAKPPSASENPTVAAEDPSGTNHGEKLWAEMTEVEKILARAKKYGTPVDEKQLAAAKLQERAKRFNLEPAQAAAKGLPCCAQT